MRPKYRTLGQNNFNCNLGRDPLKNFRYYFSMGPTYNRTFKCDK